MNMNFSTQSIKVKAKGQRGVRLLGVLHVLSQIHSLHFPITLLSSERLPSKDRWIPWDSVNESHWQEIGGWKVKDLPSCVPFWVTVWQWVLSFHENHSSNCEAMSFWNYSPRQFWQQPLSLPILA